MNNFVVVLPACRKDYGLLLGMLEWMAELGQQPTHRCTLALTPSITAEEIAVLQTAVSKVFVLWKTHVFEDSQGRFPWPIPHNAHFQKTARQLKRDLEGQPEQFWFWIEADCVPLHKDWLLRFEAEHAKGVSKGKRFTGMLVSLPHPTSTPDHMTGNAIYPRDLARWAPTAFWVSKTAWDVGAAEEIIPQANFTDILQHCYDSPKFNSVDDLRVVKPQAVVFHQSKDGGLIAMLREQKRLEAEREMMARVDTKDTLPPEELRPTHYARKNPFVGRKNKVTKGMAEEIWVGYHIGRNGLPRQTKPHLAKLFGLSLSTINRVVQEPRKFGWKPTPEQIEQAENLAFAGSKSVVAGAAAR